MLHFFIMKLSVSVSQIDIKEGNFFVNQLGGKGVYYGKNLDCAKPLYPRI
jgi:hypothetical protein